MHCVAGKRHMFVCNETGIKRNGVKTVCDQLVWIMITEWNGSMISIALVHAPTLTSCNGTPWINMGYFAHHYLEILKIVSTKIQPNIIAKQWVWDRFLPLEDNQFTKLSFASQYALWSLWMTVVLCGWKCSIFVAFFGGATDTAVCRASCTRNFLNLPPMWQQFRYLTSSVPFCMFSYSLNWSPLLETFPVLGIEF